MVLVRLVVICLLVFVCNYHAASQTGCLPNILSAIALPRDKPCDGCIVAPTNYTISTSNDTICIANSDSIASINFNGNGNCVYFCGNVKLGQLGGFGSNNKIVVTSGSTLTLYSDFSPFQNFQLIANYGNLVLAGGASNLYAPVISINKATVLVIGDVALNSGGVIGSSFYIDAGVLTVTGTVTLNTTNNENTFPDICIVSYSQINLNNLVVNSSDPLEMHPGIANMCLNVAGAVTLNQTLTQQPLSVCMAPTAFYTSPFNTNWGPNVTVTENCTQPCLSPLPLTLLSFSATAGSMGAVLEWKTAQEFQTDHFEIERSADGTLFEKIGSVKAVNNASSISSYSFVDVTATTDINYYRIRFIDIDGSFTLSPVKVVNAAATQENMIVSGGRNIVATFKKANAGTVSLFDMQGKLLSKQNVAQGQKSVLINGANLAAGTYIVRFNAASSGQTISARVIVTK